MESLKRLIQWFSLLRTCVGEANSLRETVEFLTKENQRINEIANDLRDELKKALEIAVTDHLTGVANRIFLSQNIAHIFMAHERAKSSIGMLTIDLDHFKEVNDRHGHDMGDKVLVKVSEIFRNTLRETDHVIRMGGDEFVIILTYLDNKNALNIVSDKLLKAVSEMYIDGCDIPVTLSIGGLLIGLNSNDRMSVSYENALKEVDHLLYVSKREGRNRATILSS